MTQEEYCLYCHEHGHRVMNCRKASPKQRKEARERFKRDSAMAARFNRVEIE